MAEGRVLAPWLRNASSKNNLMAVSIGTSAKAFITCEEIESFE